MTDATSSETDVDVDRLRQSLRQCRLELAGLRQGEEAREERIAVLELAERQLHDLSTVLDRHLTKAERQGTPSRRALFTRRRHPDGPLPSEVADLRRIRRSVLFDGAWYLQQYPKVVRSGLSPALHYLRLGAAQRRDPGPHFSASAYLRDHPELPKGTNPLLHYLDHTPGVVS